MDNLQEVAKKRNLACLSTIHQPSWKVLNLFTSVVLLTRGAVFYSGPPGQQMIDYFSSIGFEVPEGQNPADYYITIAEAFEKTREAEDRVLHLLSSWKKHEEGRKSSIESKKSEEVEVGNGNRSAKDELEEKRKDEMNDSQMEGAKGWATPWLMELKVLTGRNFKQIMRDPAIIYGSLGQTSEFFLSSLPLLTTHRCLRLDTISDFSFSFFLPLLIAFRSLYLSLILF